VTRVEVAVARVTASGRCRWYGPRGSFGRAASSCARPVYLRTRGVARWRRHLAALAGPGTYRVLSRAVPGEAQASVRTFHVK
jgi:hypothetical protein